jgi:predicted DNA-binding transcriptional regulator AlpA
MTHKEELMRKIQNQRKFLDDLLLEIAALQEPVPVEATVIQHQEIPEQDRLMRAREVQEFLGIKPATFYDWIKKGFIPAGEDFGGCTRSKRWRLSVISASLEGKKESRPQDDQSQIPNKRRAQYGARRP